MSLYRCISNGGGNATEKIAEDFVAKSNLTNTYTLGRGTYFVTAVAMNVSQYSVSSYTFTLSTTGTIIYNAAGDSLLGQGASTVTISSTSRTVTATCRAAQWIIKAEAGDTVTLTFSGAESGGKGGQIHIARLY